MHPLSVLLCAGLVLAPPAAAQEEPESIVFAAYYRCDQSREARTDTIYDEVIAPLWQKQVDAGLLTTFGWARHWAGGEWRRLSYIIGTDLDAMVEAREAYIAEVLSDHADEARAFNSICPSHDDYIWYRVAGSQPPEELAQERPAVGLTSYMICDDEAAADELIQTAFAPIMNKHVEDGDISSWAWLEHNVGGVYRRALVLDAAGYKEILNYWNKLFEDIGAEHPELLRKYGEACVSHADYIWDLSANQ
jgi:hypothetical protein